MISNDALRQRTSFSSDLNVDASAFPPWQEGDFLVKTNALLAGCAHRAKPVHPLRLLIFAKHPSHASEASSDPWRLMAIDRPACFVVADVRTHEDNTQYTLVEIGPHDLADTQSLQLDAQARATVAAMFDQACSQLPAAYENDPIFMRAVGTDSPTNPQDLLERATGDEALAYMEENNPERKTRAAAASSVSEDTEQADTNNQQLAPEPVVADEISHSAYQESDDSWIVALAESILSESAAKSYLAADERTVQAEPGTADEAPGLAAAANALYDTLHAQPDTPESEHTTAAVQPESNLAPEAQAAGAATALYETLHLAEARLDETPDYIDIPLDAGLKFFQAHNRALAAHPALEYAESQRNFARLLNRNLGGALISRMYAGNATPASESERDAEARRLWFDPFSGCNFFPLLSHDVESYLDGMRIQYGQFEQAQDSAGLAVVHRQLDLIDRALHGDTDACIQLIESDRRRLHLPYRYEFSVSFDVEQHQALVNLFLPQKAIFPLAMRSEDGDAAYSASSFNQRYQGVACALALITLYLVKMDAAWVKDMGLNVWYRTEDKPKCVCSLRVNESQLAEHTTSNTQQAFQALKDMQARIHSGNHHELLGLDALFNLHEALDHPFGFKTFANGWTFPHAYTTITAEATATNLDHTVSMLLDLIARGKNASAYEIAQAHEQVYRSAWLEPLGPDVVPLSCENALEETLALQLPSKHARTVLPHRLGQLYHILGTLAHDAGDRTAARVWLQQAVALNPVGALSLIELGKVELLEDKVETADRLLDAARQVATTPYALAQIAKYRAMCFAQIGRNDYAYHLYSYAYHLYESESHQLVCLAGIHDVSAAAADTSANAIPANPAPLATCLTFLQEHGRQTGISDTVMALVKPAVEEALAGGPLPDAAYVDAYLCALYAAGHDVERARSLVLNVHTVRFGDFPFSDYLFKPILLCDNDIVYTIDTSIGLAPETPGANVGLVAVPYIDPHAGLTLQVLGTADIQTRQPVKVLASPVKLSATPFRATPFRLLRTRDYPAFPIAATADMLNRVYAPDQLLDATRARRDIDLLRDFSNPDNILVVLVRPNVRPEGVWATLVQVDSEGTLHARLANEPFDDFGIHMGDIRPLHLQIDAETGLALAFMQSLS